MSDWEDEPPNAVTNAGPATTQNHQNNYDDWDDQPPQSVCTICVLFFVVFKFCSKLF